LQFLTFYQILEYFFIKVSDELLYQKISCQLNDPKFKTTKTRNLDHLIHIIEEHKRTNNETEMLKNVLKKFIDDSDIIKFIQAYEAYIGKNLYTKKRTLFGEEITQANKTGHIFGNIAKIIKTVRNALVHSSDRYERYERHIPFSESTEIVRNEIPLVKFLAEKVIIASASIYSFEE